MYSADYLPTQNLGRQLHPSTGMVPDCPLGKPLLRPDAELLEAYFREIRCRGWPCRKSLGDTNSEMAACCWNPKTVERYSPRNKSDRITLLGIPCRSIPECPFGREMP